MICGHYGQFVCGGIMVDIGLRIVRDHTCLNVNEHCRCNVMDT